MRNRPLLIAGAAALAAAIPALAQQGGGTQPSPGGGQPVANTTAPAGGSGGARLSTGPDEIGTLIQQIEAAQLPPPPPPIEYPAHARRDPWVVGRLDPADLGLGASPWGSVSGTFLSTLMRRMDTPLASRWAHIALRNALLARARAPNAVNPVDWTAERAWLLLRMGEADAARMLIYGVDTDRFTPKMTQVAVQSALANGDPPALCPIEQKIRRFDPAIRELVSAMCASLSGEPESAAAQIDHARRYGRIGGIDLTLAEKVVGAGANTGRAVTIEWGPVDTLTAWRFGLATATGMRAPDRLLRSAPARLRAFEARAPLLSAEQRLESALIAAGLGVFSSQSLVDLYSTIYDGTDPSDLPATDAWKLRQAFVAPQRDGRMGAIRQLLEEDGNSLRKEASRALVARAASRIGPDPELEADAPELVSAMLAAGYDVAAARWANALRGMDGETGDRVWAMLALSSPDGRGIEISFSRIAGFVSRDKSPGKARSALLVAGLAGLGRINNNAVNTLNRRYGLGIGRQSSWTRMIDAAAGRGQSGSVLILAGTGLQTPSWSDVPGAHLYHAVAALKRTGQDFTARMIAAEALSRT